MFFEPEPTQFDVNFRLLGVHIRVHPLFWVISAILGWPALRLGFRFLLLWVLCVFVSILLHELGHVFAGRLFGSHGHIVLFSLGGLAIGSSNLARRWQRIIVYFAGPLVQLVLFVALLGLVLFYPPSPPDPDQVLASRSLVHEAISDLLQINLFWPLLNLLPIWPLDGGRISREILEGIFGSRGLRASLGISFLVAALIALNALAVEWGHPLIPFFPFGGMYTAIFFGMFALNSYQALQMESRPKPWEEEREGW